MNQLLLFLRSSFSSESRQFARIHTSLLNTTQTLLNRPITKFYNGDDVNMIATELRPTDELMPTYVNEVFKTKC